MLEIVLVLILADVIPIGLWMYYFNDKNPRTQPLKEVISIFLLGTFSIFPVMVFHKYVSTLILSKVTSLHPFLSEPFIMGTLQLSLILIFVVVFIVIFSILNALILRLKYNLSLRQSFDSTTKKLYNLTPLLLFLIVFLVVEMGSIFTLEQSFIVGAIGSTLLFATLEEYFKYIINPFLAYKRVNSVGNAMVNALYIGLAFAFVENALFFYEYYTDENFVFIFIYRSLFTTLMHVGASGIIGYFYGISLFSKSMLTNYEIEKGQYQVPGWLKKLLGMNKNKTFQSASVTQGFVIAALIHGLFNVLLEIDLKIISAIVVMILTGVIIYLLTNKATQVQYGLIGSSTMPQEDFEKLRLQISVLQHAKDIRLNRMSTLSNAASVATQSNPPNLPSQTLASQGQSLTQTDPSNQVARAGQEMPTQPANFQKPVEPLPKAEAEVESESEPPTQG